MRARREGQGAVEYVVVVGLLALLLIPAVTRFSAALQAAFGRGARAIEVELTVATAPGPARAAEGLASPAARPRPAAARAASTSRPADAPPETRTKTLSWDPNPEPGVVGYRVRWGLEPGRYAHVADVASTSYRLEGLERGRRYHVAVSAVARGGLESAPSELSVVID